MKEWPDNNEPVDFTDLVKPICEAIRFAYDLQRKNEGKDIPYDGYGKDKSFLSMSDPDYIMSVEYITYADEDQDRDALESIMMVAIQVGMAQGRRMANKDNEKRKETLAAIVNVAANVLDSGDTDTAKSLINMIKPMVGLKAY